MKSNQPLFPTLFLSPLLFFSFFLSFLSPPTQNHLPTFPPDLLTFKIDFSSLPHLPSFRLRNGIETRSRGTRDPTQRRDYTRGRVDTNHHPFQLENPPGFALLLNGQLLIEEESSHACLITFFVYPIFPTRSDHRDHESLLAFNLIKKLALASRIQLGCDFHANSPRKWGR